MKYKHLTGPHAQVNVLPNTSSSLTVLQTYCGQGCKMPDACQHWHLQRGDMIVGYFLSNSVTSTQQHYRHQPRAWHQLRAWPMGVASANGRTPQYPIYIINNYRTLAIIKGGVNDLLLHREKEELLFILYFIYSEAQPIYKEPPTQPRGSVILSISKC